MSNIAFSYADFEATRVKLIDTLRHSLDEVDKQFLLSLNRLEPDWSVHDFQHFPSVKWKFLNLANFKEDSLEIYQLQLDKLEALLQS